MNRTELHMEDSTFFSAEKVREIAANLGFRDVLIRLENDWNKGQTTFELTRPGSAQPTTQEVQQAFLESVNNDDITVKADEKTGEEGNRVVEVTLRY